MCYKRSSSYSWAYKEGELDFVAVAKCEKSRKLGEFASLLYPASSFKGGLTLEVLTPRSRPHLIDHIFGARITLILLFARLFY